jgi:putative ABC transport system permease protein
MRDKRKNPPSLGQWILKQVVSGEENLFLTDGIDETFRAKTEERGYLIALLWYWYDFLFTLPRIISENIKWSIVMLKNYIKTVFRIIRKQKIFSLINLSGLTIGLTSCILIMIYVKSELSYDMFHENAENIYRVIMHQPGNTVVGSGNEYWVVSPAILKPTWENDLPEIEQASRIGRSDVILNKDGQVFSEYIYFTDPEYFDIFTFPLILGDAKTALNKPFALVISQSMARKYFGDENPLGKTISSRGENVYEVTGVLADIPENTHLKMEFISSFITLNTLWNGNVVSDRWLNNPFDTYLTLAENTDLNEFDKKLRKYDLEGMNGTTWSFHVQPLKDIHFSKMTRGDGDIRYIYIFSAVGLVILLISCFNFVNLSTARAAARAKELGIRKIIGAYKKQIIRQLMGESVLFCFLALILSLIAVYFTLPAFNYLIGKELSFQSLADMKFASCVFGLTIFIGILSGFYPAVCLSSFRPVNILRGNYNLKTGNSSLFRNSLLVVQFVISVIMIISTITFYYQLNFIKNRKLGYDSAQILNISAHRMNVAAFKSELLGNPAVLKVAGSSGIPTRVGWSNVPAWNGKDPEDNTFFYRLNVDFDFMDLYGLEMVKGRSFSEEFESDRGKTYILNEAAVNRIGWDDPIGQEFGFWEITGSVIGVVKDFNFESLRNPVTPLGIGVFDRNDFNYISVKVRPENINGTIDYIKTVWKKLSPDVPIELSFHDERLNNMYQAEQKMAESFTYFTMIAIFIACLGLFGITSFLVARKTKEIGIRKVLGANTMKITRLLSKDFVVLVVLANIFAWPLAWYVMEKWLETFAFRINLNILHFLSAGIITLLIAILTVSFQSVKAAWANPVQSLRNE